MASPIRGRQWGEHPLAPLPGADSPYQGEMSRRDKRGRDAGSAQPRLRGRRRSAGKDPNRKFSLRFGKEETSTEEKRRRLRRLVPSWSFLTRLRRPLLFRLAGKEGGEKGRWVTVWRFLPLNSGESRYLAWRSTRESPCERHSTRRLIRGKSDLQLVALERLPSIEGAVEILMDITFLRGRL